MTSVAVAESISNRVMSEPMKNIDVIRAWCAVPFLAVAVLVLIPAVVLDSKDYSLEWFKKRFTRKAGAK